MASSTNSSKLRNAGAAAYWGSKAFQALRVCSGDLTAIAEIAGELLGEGLVADAVANPGMLVEAIESLVNVHDGIKGFRTSVTNFSQFSRALAIQLASRGEKANSSTFAAADRIYSLFMECDRDGSGGVSLEEYIIFCSKEGVPASMAKKMFFQADVDGNGQISFEEWTTMMNGRVGRDPKSFNCGGHHGLTIYTAPCNGLKCDFCMNPISAGSQASGCRRCDCDACAACSGITHTPPIPPRHGYTEPPATSSPLRTAPGSLNCLCGHGLMLFTVTTWMRCNYCQRGVTVGNVAVGCRVCNFDACMECVAVNLASNSASLLTCPGRHRLALTRTSAPGYACDFCRGNVAVGVPIFSCRYGNCLAIDLAKLQRFKIAFSRRMPPFFCICDKLCQVDACPSCVWNDHIRVLNSGGAFSCRGNHLLKTTHIMSYGQIEDHKCSWCRGNPVMGERMLWCNICCVSVCNACLVHNPTQAPPSCGKPPPLYHESISPHDPPPLPPRPKAPDPPPPPPRHKTPGGSKRKPPPRYDDLQEHVACPEMHTPSSASATPPFRLNSLVRVVGALEKDVEGKLMTVLGFEPDGKGHDGEESGILVAQRRGKVYKISTRYVYAVVI